MFGLLQQSIIKSEILSNFTDYHSHILPNIDDGIKSIEKAISVLDSYQALGVKQVVFTPHIMEDYPLNNAVSIRSKFEEFKKSYHGKIKLSLGAEYMLDSQFEKHLKSSDLLPIIDNYLLIETSCTDSPIHFIERLNEIQTKGYFVVLAHPERYTYMQDDDYKHLKRIGILFQLNLLSMVGTYGKKAKQKAKMLLHSDCYSFIGTDIHNLEFHLNEFQNRKLRRKDIDHILCLKNI